MLFAAKAHISDVTVEILDLVASKTMYRGKDIAAGDAIFLFASENEGGLGLVARGIVIDITRIPRINGVERQTPRVSINVELTAVARRRLGRAELKSFTRWNDGKPETELNFKLYRQATNKIVGISEAAAKFLESFF